jgi:hypothetical protein
MLRILPLSDAAPSTDSEALALAPTVVDVAAAAAVNVQKRKALPLSYR